ncbi:hypothetical protein C8J56DRAFT_1052146 [Mycena floridula]|nr:hypothetical protein C8J56DRAFT_1052146 [Mycena floridula]
MNNSVNLTPSPNLFYGYNQYHPTPSPAPSPGPYNAGWLASHQQPYNLFPAGFAQQFRPNTPPPAQRVALGKAAPTITKRKRKKKSDTDGRAPQRQKTNGPPAPAVFGVDPVTEPTYIPIAAPKGPLRSIVAEAHSTHSSAAAASDVWYFVRGLESANKPAGQIMLRHLANLSSVRNSVSKVS